jgi:hypothetical protein
LLSQVKFSILNVHKEDLKRKVEESEGFMYPTAMRSLVVLSGRNCEKGRDPVKRGE